ncbi:fibrinogen C domain-containing protein 1-like [Diabrotica undecimpunctata]|uniref:fibrinogen C domain-containing protein 1-like n=1 Tax=Diabrotica undecimpunctata TaxID=50387 RepID=UPI003B63557B
MKSPDDDDVEDDEGKKLKSPFEPSELLVELTDEKIETEYAHYGSFAITAEKDGYRLNVLSGYSGTVGDALIGHLNSKLSTSDVDLDENHSGSCAKMFEGAWWYRYCHDSCLNGKYQNLGLLSSLKFHGITWNGFRGKEYNLAGSRMMVRPKRI